MWVRTPVSTLIPGTLVQLGTLPVGTLGTLVSVGAHVPDTLAPVHTLVPVGTQDTLIPVNTLLPVGTLPRTPIRIQVCIRCHHNRRHNHHRHNRILRHKDVPGVQVAQVARGDHGDPANREVPPFRRVLYLHTGLACRVYRMVPVVQLFQLRHKDRALLACLVGRGFHRDPGDLENPGVQEVLVVRFHPVDPQVHGYLPYLVGLACP